MEFLNLYAVFGAIGFFAFGVGSHWLISKAVGLAPALKNPEDEKKRMRANSTLLKMLRGFHYVGFPVIGYVMGPQLLPKVLG